MNYAKVTRIFLVLMLVADIITENPVFNSCLHLGIWNLCAIINHSGQPFLSCCALFLSWCFYDDILFFFLMKLLKSSLMLHSFLREDHMHKDLIAGSIADFIHL